MLLWCYVANHGGGDPGMGVDSKGQPLPLDEMADESLFDSQADLEAFLDLLADKKHIDPATWTDRRIVFLPAMAKRADAYAKSKGRGKKPSGPGEAGAARADAGEKSPGAAQAAPVSPLHTTPHHPKQTKPRQKRQGVPGGTPPESSGPVELVAAWNLHRKQGPKVSQLTPDRRDRYTRALKVEPDLAKWTKVIDWLETQPWANAKGKGEHANWRADLDYLARPGKLTAAHERMVADVGGERRAATQGRAAPEAGKYSNLDNGGDGGDDDRSGG